MKCPSCEQEIALARICPYCGRAVPHDESSRQSPPREPQGTFRGRADHAPGKEEQGGAAKRPALSRVLRFFLDPRIDPVRKGAAVAALLYVLSPFDLFPGALLPLLGWLDDLVVLGFVWRLVEQALRKLD